MREESNYELKLLLFAVLAGIVVYFYFVFLELNFANKVLFIVTSLGVTIFIGLFVIDRFSKWGRENRKRLELIKELPAYLYMKTHDSVVIGQDIELKTTIFLPDSIRSKHVHIIGATGSGKTESVVLNFIKQDVLRGYGAIILDAKGDMHFLRALQASVAKRRLKMFDLVSEKSLTYDPLCVGTPLEAAQRLFSSLTWSEEYYKSKALSALQKLFQIHFETYKKNPKLTDLAEYLEDPENYTSITCSDSYPEALGKKDFAELSGLRDQVKSLCTGHLSKLLSPNEKSDISLDEAGSGKVLYFRLQSLLSPQLVSTLGKLLINNLNYLAGTAHRVDRKKKSPKFIPTFLDEFASFACPEFGDLISKARSAGLALHFSHQSVGDLAEVSKGFLNRITDNSAVKIVMRINDPDSADFFARSFGTKIYQKVTQRITNSKEVESAEVVGEGSTREAHQFRASPDLFKTLPTGVGSVLIAHGLETPHGASSVLRIKFPRLMEV